MMVRVSRLQSLVWGIGSLLWNSKFSSSSSSVNLSLTSLLRSLWHRYC